MAQSDSMMLGDPESQKTNYPKKGAGDDPAGVANTGRSSDSKELGSGTMDMIKGGGVTGESDGPTGSSRSYAKGSKPSMDANRFNPMNSKPTGYATGGVGKGED
jgi:hypothetical protein